MVSVFISYSWDDASHKDWVLDLARRLQRDNVIVKLDQIDLALGDELTEYMETSIRESDKVLIVCTPTYKTKSDKRVGGVGYEESIITGEVFSNRNNRKFIPILRRGTWKESAPTWLLSKVYSDFCDTGIDEEKYQELLQNITDFKVPCIKTDTQITNESLRNSSIDNEDIRIKGIIVEEVTVPKMDGTPGSALYAIPFKLSKHPSIIWKGFFLQTWECPPSFTTMHRKRIARVNGDKLILDGTTIEEVEKYHKKTLLLCITEANKKEKEHLQKEAHSELLEHDKIKYHEQQIIDSVKKIKFD